jgi:hypothetical protein
LLQFLGLVAFIIFSQRFRYRAIKHSTFDAEALALAPEGRGAPNFSIRITKSEWQGAHQALRLIAIPP